MNKELRILKLHKNLHFFKVCNGVTRGNRFKAFLRKIILIISVFFSANHKKVLPHLFI
jgi:hypothetical protein